MDIYWLAWCLTVSEQLSKRKEMNRLQKFWLWNNRSLEVLPCQVKIQELNVIWHC